MTKMKLLPFTIESLSVTEKIKEIPYGIKQCGAVDIWEQGEKGNGIVVAVLDTGVDANHSDLKKNIIGGRNFTADGDSYKDFNDLNGHGTHVAGTIAANGKIKGVAPEAKILALKVLDRHGDGNYYSIIEGLRYATNWKGANGERVRIINMSLGGSKPHKYLYQAILQAVAKGIIVVVASGNKGDGNRDTFEYEFPANYNECVTVAACNEKSELADFSNNHLEVDVIAAGVDVLSTYKNGGYATLSGTSTAAPHISGTLALLIKMGEKKFKRTLTESEIYSLLIKCCCSLGYPASAEGNGQPNLKEVFKEC